MFCSAVAAMKWAAEDEQYLEVFPHAGCFRIEVSSLGKHVKDSG